MRASKSSPFISNLQRANGLVIEGTGGILAPLNEREVWADAAINWGAQWVLVHRHYLGSLNHCLLTIEALRQREISLVGIVFNGEGDAATEEDAPSKSKMPLFRKTRMEKNRPIANRKDRKRLEADHSQNSWSLRDQACIWHLSRKLR